MRGIAASSGLALVALALAEVPHLGAAALPLVTAVLVVPAMVFAGAALVAKRLGGDRWERIGVGWTPRLLAGLVGGAVFFVGGALSNTLLVDAPAEPWTVAGYGISLLLGALALLLTARATRRPWAREAFGRHWRAIFAGMSFAVGVGATAVDAYCFPHAFPWAHAIAILGALAGFTAAAVVMCHARLLSARPRAWLRHVGASMLVVTVAAASYSIHESGTEGLMRTTSGARALFVMVRDRIDRDGDGYSAWFGGADCDDDDPLAYPLSTVGRDCLAIVPSKDEASPAAASPPLARGDETVLSTAPEIVLLVTIDAFRCGFGQGERPELTHACPNLAELASEGRFQQRAYARAPHTIGSLSSIFAHRTETSLEPLPVTLRERGYRTEAITTHRGIFKIPKLRESLDDLDESLAPLSEQSHTVTSEQVTDRLLSRVEKAAEEGARTFIWAHYYDAHSPYVQSPDSRFVWSRNDAYVEEIQRTDRAIGRLVSSVKELVPDDRLALFVTADHGEELGEHGGSDHGRTLYDEVVRVPFLAWRSGADPVAGLPSTLPAGNVDMAPYIFSVVTGATFTSSEAVVMTAKPPNDEIVGVVQGDLKYILHYRLGYEELFDLRADPNEEHDLAAEQGDDVRALRQVLGAMLRREHEEPVTL